MLPLSRHQSRLFASFLLAAAFLCSTLSAQSLTGFLQHLSGLSGLSERQDAVDSFWAQLPAVPWINGDTAHFLYTGSVTGLQVAGDFNGWNPTAAPATQAFGTTLWHYSRVFEPNARQDYKLVRNGSDWILDPANPNTVSGGFGPNSELAMPAYVQPWEIDDRGAPAGTVTTSSIASASTGKTYSLQIYLPPGYDDTRAEGYPVAYFQDGHEYVGLASAARIFDNLLDSNLIEPVIGVFVRPTDRNNEYAGSIRFDYAGFFGTELVPYIDDNYNTAPFAVRRAVIGASFGGNISAIITLEYPDLFANCGLHSGAFWPESYKTYNDWIASTPSTDLRVASIWGSYEGGLSSNMADFVDVLISDGTEHYWEERPEGHSWGLWRATTDDMLKLFFPPEGRPVGLMAQETGREMMLFPNPASSFVQVEMPSIPGESTWYVLDPAGRMLRRGTLAPASSQLLIEVENLSPGMYWLLHRAVHHTTSSVFQIAR